MFNDQDKEFDNNKLNNLDSVSVKNPYSDNKFVIKKYLVDELDKNTILRFNQKLQNYLRGSVGDDLYNLTKYDKKQINDTTNIFLS